MIPLSLYVHIPWCVRKCPYCDFNSHNAPDNIPEEEYIKALLRDLDNDLPTIRQRTIQTIFIGGGTPSLFSPRALKHLLLELHKRLAYSSTIEITLEANPGTIDWQRFAAYRELGINRLSIGVQSFQEEKLSALGRIHGSREAHQAIEVAKKAGFENYNIDLMYGLPNQSIDEALDDLRIATSYSPTHLSWYQLTIEPNTYFFQFPPTLPIDDYIWDMQNEGQSLLATGEYKQYEISAYSQNSFQCKHNRNYWEFGDYLGIGAGAHSKITKTTGSILRSWKIKHPKFYLAANKFVAGKKQISAQELPLEFMMNALRLYENIPYTLFEERTRLSISSIANCLQRAESLGLLIWEKASIKTTLRGKQYLNDLLECFIDK